MADDLATLVPRALRTLLSETLFRASPHGGYLLNAGDPGWVDTLKALTASTVSTPPGQGRKPIVSHAHHVLFGFELIHRALAGDAHAFEGADWDAAWKLEHVTEAEWADLLRRIETHARQIVDMAPRFQAWNEVMLTGLFACAAHTAYHLGAVRQLVRDVAEAT